MNDGRRGRIKKTVKMTAIDLSLIGVFTVALVVLVGD